MATELEEVVLVVQVVVDSMMMSNIIFNIKPIRNIILGIIYDRDGYNYYGYDVSGLDKEDGYDEMASTFMVSVRQLEFSS